MEYQFLASSIFQPVFPCRKHATFPNIFCFLNWIPEAYHSTFNFYQNMYLDIRLNIEHQIFGLHLIFQTWLPHLMHVNSLHTFFCRYKSIIRYLCLLSTYVSKSIWKFLFLNIIYVWQTILLHWNFYETWINNIEHQICGFISFSNLVRLIDAW